jgi:protein-S-isoprenylcysteine O-methyltransferase Ste14
MGVMSKPTLALASAGGLVAFLGLAILGWGGFEPFFANPARIALVIATVAMVVAALFSSVNLSTGEREDRSNRWVIGVLSLIGLLSAWLPAYTDRKEFWVLDGDIVRWLGVALYVVGGALRLWPIFILGRRFSGLVAIQPGHALVTDGLYSRIRNPSYLGLLILSLGWALAFRSGAGVLLAALNIPSLVARMNSEERLLQAQFGREYEAYRARTWRLLPGLY